MYLGAQSLTLVKKEMVFISQGIHLISEVRARVLFYFIQAYTYLGIYSTLRSKKVFQILHLFELESSSEIPLLTYTR